MYYRGSKNYGADQLRGYREADLRVCFRLGRLLVFPCVVSIYIAFHLHKIGCLILADSKAGTCIHFPVYIDNFPYIKRFTCKGV